MNIYTEIISRNLQIDENSAQKIQDFINNWYEFRWSSATTKQIVQAAKEVQSYMADPRFAELVEYKAGA